MKSLLNILKLCLFLLLLGAGGASILSCFARHHAYLEALSHFKIQYLVILGIVFTGFLLLKNLRGLAVSGLLMLFTILPLLPYYLPQSQPTGKPLAQIRVMQCNVLEMSTQYDQVIDFVKESHPDIIGFEEVGPAWAQHLETLKSEYPYFLVAEPHKTAFGAALFSKLPLDDPKIVYFGKPYGPDKRKFPSILATIHLADEPVSVVVTHPLPPLKGSEVRVSQLADMADQRKNWHPNVILLGDLNVSPWSPYFEDLVKKANLKDSQLGFGVQNSWPTYSQPLKISIDHVLASPRFQVLNRTLGKDVGSDHLPVIVDMALTR